jgi:hypothetical protein
LEGRENTLMVGIVETEKAIKFIYDRYRGWLS